MQGELASIATVVAASSFSSELSILGGNSLIAEFIDLCVSRSLAGVGGLRSDMV